MRKDTEEIQVERRQKPYESAVSALWLVSVDLYLLGLWQSLRIRTRPRKSTSRAGRGGSGTGLILGALCLAYLSFKESHTQTRTQSMQMSAFRNARGSWKRAGKVMLMFRASPLLCTHGSVSRCQDPTLPRADVVSPPALDRGHWWQL